MASSKAANDAIIHPVHVCFFVWVGALSNDVEMCISEEYNGLNIYLFKTNDEFQLLCLQI